MGNRTGTYVTGNLNGTAGSINTATTLENMSVSIPCTVT